MREARDWLLGAENRPDFIVDLGAGLGSISFALARRDSVVICVDTSLPRLKKLRARAAEARCAESILAIVADANALPFRDASLGAIFTKSVLIHVDLPRAADEIARVLAPRGRAALVEPQTGNPLAWLYRRTFAPKAWRSITRYFDGESQQLCIRSIGRGSVRPFYLSAFLTFVFQFAWPNLRLFNTAMRCLHPIDRWVLRHIGWTRSLAWFGVIEVERVRSDDETGAADVRPPDRSGPSGKS